MVETTLDGVQIRRYESRVAAKTALSGTEERARSVGFRRLAAYIFGANYGNTTVAMTAPVSQHRDSGGARIGMTAPVSQHSGPDGSWVSRFFMPAAWTLDSLPPPDNAAVKLVAVPAETVAVLRFTGVRGPRVVASRTEELLCALQGSGFQDSSAPTAWFYHPPWTLPCLRRNEIAVPVTARRTKRHRGVGPGQGLLMPTASAQ